ATSLARGHRNPIYAARGGLTRRNPGRNVAVENNELDDAPYAPDPLAEKDDSDPLDLVSKRMKDLDLVQQKARRAMAFRLVTGVSKNDKWPKWGEQMPGMSVNFEAQVNESDNPDLIVRVAEVSMQELKAHSSVHATWMNAPNVKLTYAVLRELAKTSFRGFRTMYKAQMDQEKASRQKKNEQASRWQNRRNKKCDRLMSAVPRYMEIHGVDPSDLLTPDLMSDEASGPEDDADNEAVTTWRRQMAEHAGITGKTDTQLAKMSFFEVIKPNWRSDELTKVFRDLSELFNESVPIKSLRMMVERVRDAGRSTDDVPGYAPYDFGVNMEWYERVKETHGRCLGSWLKHPDPPGFGENATSTELGTSET
ncbi:hypothetical protein BD309DRAFT_873245, partial [Dichomitus squalens]